MADSFNTRFRPVTLEIPRALLPVVNVPLIDYTLEFLAAAGLKEVYVYCCSHAAKIQQHVQSQWAHTIPGIKTIDGSILGSRSVGDALRHLLEDFGDDIKHDFLLVGGDVVSNMKLKQALENHRRRKATDPRYIMTSIFKQASPSHRTRAGEDDTILAIDRKTSQILHYENNREARQFSVDRAKFLEHTEVQFRYDLLDCYVDICTPQVLELYKEHFDFQHHRRDFLRSILDSSFDLVNTIHLEIIDDEYAARVRDLYTYGAVSRDLIRRWCYPFVPDNNRVGDTTFSYTRGNIYLENSIDLARTCTIGQNTLIGRGTSVGGDSRISHSVIGRHCIIGHGVQIHNSFIWDGAVIGDNVRIDHALICTGVHVQAGAVVEPGCVLAGEVVVPGKLVIPRETKLTHRTMEHHTQPFEAIDGVYSWQENSCLSADEDDHSEDDVAPRLTRHCSFSSASLNSLIYSPFISESDSDSSEGSEDPDQESLQMGNFERFHDELSAMTRTALTENWKVEDALVQIKSFKFSVDKTFIDCAQIVFPILLESLPPTLSPKDLLDAFRKLITVWSKFLKVCFPPDDQLELLLLIQDFCSAPQGKHLLAILALGFNFLYEQELVEEEAFLSWESELKSDKSAEAQLILKRAQPFLDWLREASEDSEEDDDSDDASSISSNDDSD